MRCLYGVLVLLATAGASAPSQIHISFGAAPDTATVSWVGGGTKLLYGVSASCALPLGPRGGETGCSSSAAATTSYAHTSIPRNTSGGYVTYNSPQIRNAPLTKLAPGTRYYYGIVAAAAAARGSDTASGAGADTGGDNGDTNVVASAVLSFVTAPAVGTGGKAGAYFTFAAIGDLGQTADSLETVNHIKKDTDIAVVLHAGDMAYADCDGGRWDSYFDMIEPLASTVAWQVAAGNHEIEPNKATGGNIMDPYKHRFAMPEVAPTVDTTAYIQDPSQNGFDCTPSAFTGSYDYGNSFYSMRIGAAHVIVLNSYTRTDNASNQYAWLEKELNEKVDRVATPWLIAMWHSPWYNSNAGHQNESNTLGMKSNLESLLLAARVNMVISGHVHAYERSHPVAKGVVDGTKGITYLNIGDGGNREGHSMTYLERPTWNAFRNGTDYGHGRVQLINATHARWEWHVNPDVEWKVEDTVVIVNQLAMERAYIM